MSMLLAFLGPLIFLTFLTGTLIYAFRKKFNFQFLLPLAVIASTLFVYFFTFIFHHITAGVIVVAAASLAFIPLLILDKNRRNTLKSLLLTPAFVIFVALYSLLFFYHYNTIPQLFSDDLMHWAPHVWTMWLTDNFYTAPELSIVTHGDYPPILQLFQLIFVKFAGEYREGLLYLALEITCFSMLFPVLKNLVWQRKNVAKTLLLSLLIFVSLLVIPATLDVTHLFYNALHPDYAIAFVFVLGIFLAVSESKKFNWITAGMISLTVAFLCLTKQSSVLFGGLVGLIYAIGLWYAYKQTPKRFVKNLAHYLKDWRRHWVAILLALILLILPLAALKLWQGQIKGFEAPYCCVAIFHVSPSDALKVPGVLLRQDGNESQQNYARDFFRYILTYQAGFTLNLVSNVSYMQFILLFIGAMVFVGYNYRDKFRRSQFTITVLVIVAGWFVYAFAIYLTFLFGGMKDPERDNLLTGDRYLRTYIFALLLMLFVMLITFIVTKFNQTKKAANKTLVLFAVSIIAVLGFLFNIDIIKNGYLVESFKFKHDYSNAGISNASEFSKKMHTFTNSLGGTYADPKKIAITEQPDVQTIYYLRYLTLPNKIENGSDLMFDDKLKQDDVCKVLENSDFLFIKHVYNDSSSLDKVNHCITNHIDSFKQYEAFKIEKDGNSIKLVDWHF